MGSIARGARRRDRTCSSRPDRRGRHSSRSTCARRAIWVRWWRPARRELRQLDRTLLFEDVRTLDDLIAFRMAAPRLSAGLAIGPGLAGLALALFGLYAVLAYLVAQRRTELAIRMSIGARPRQIVRLIAGFGLRVTVVGRCSASRARFVCARLLAAQLKGVDPYDPADLRARHRVRAARGACRLPAARAPRRAAGAVGDSAALAHHHHSPAGEKVRDCRGTGSPQPSRGRPISVRLKHAPRAPREPSNRTDLSRFPFGQSGNASEEVRRNWISMLRSKRRTRDAAQLMSHIARLTQAAIDPTQGRSLSCRRSSVRYRVSGRLAS